MMGKVRRAFDADNAPKRRRAPNFTESEIKLVIKLVLDHINVIEDKTTSAPTWKKKESTWMWITKEFNAVSDGGTVRTAVTIRNKYEGMKKELRRKVIESQRQQDDSVAAAAACIDEIAPSPRYISIKRYEKDLLQVLANINNGRSLLETTQQKQPPPPVDDDIQPLSETSSSEDGTPLFIKAEDDTTSDDVVNVADDNSIVLNDIITRFVVCDEEQHSETIFLPITPISPTPVDDAQHLIPSTPDLKKNSPNQKSEVAHQISSPTLPIATTADAPPQQSNKLDVWASMRRRRHPAIFLPHATGGGKRKLLKIAPKPQMPHGGNSISNTNYSNNVGVGNSESARELLDLQLEHARNEEARRVDEHQWRLEKFRIEKETLLKTEQRLKDEHDCRMTALKLDIEIKQKLLVQNENNSNS